MKTQQDSPAALAIVASSVTTRPFSDTVANVTFQNGLVEWRGFDDDGRIVGYGVRDGTTQIFHRVLTYADGINLTQAQDVLQGAKTETYAYTDTNRLSQAVGPWGTESFVTDGVGNRTGRC